MFEATSALSTGQLTRLVAALSTLDEGVDDAEWVDRIRALEELKAAAAAAQAQVTTQLVASQRAAQAAAGVAAADLGTGVAAQVGLAKRESPARARRYLGWAQILVGELPHTFTALRCGQTTEWRALLVARETGWLSAEHRAAVDAALGPRLAALGDRQVEAEAKRAAYRLDPHGYLARTRGKHADRRVSIRPAPDAMARLTGFLPVAQAVAAYANLQAHADSLISSGDPRGRGQIMADTLVQRLTGQTSAAAVPATINLVMSDHTLFNRRNPSSDGRPGDAQPGGDEPAHLHGYGPIPADLARRLVADAPAGTPIWLRRLYTHPDSGQLVAMDSQRRRFDHGLRTFLVLRDQTCRTPWCDAPIRHADHVVAAAAGGPTSADNGQGLCQACNHAKQAPGWSATPTPAGSGHQVVTTTTPTGHRYHSRAPDPPGTTPAHITAPAASLAEQRLRQLLLAA
ncbi:MAG TPA: DUF222 domain-containing protein [Nocardioidaceae bacterium]|nr:DUF222 domain-containing protein [Nocardioidaceae bacterium]